MKNFQKWHYLKSRIDEDSLAVFFRAQEVWWCSLGANVGVETDGKSDLFQRPVLILRKFNREMFYGLPLTTKVKNKPYYFAFTLNNKNQAAILSQLRNLSSKRLIRRLGKISDKEFEKLNETLNSFLNKTDPLRDPQVPNGNNKKR